MDPRRLLSRVFYLIGYDALVGRPPALRLLACVQEVGGDVAETGHLGGAGGGGVNRKSEVC